MDANKLTDTRLRLSIECERLGRSIDRQRLNAEELKIEHTEDENDLASMSHDRDLLYNLHEGDFAHLRFIQDAINAIDSGQYGACIDCGNEINAKRLEAVPWARMCLHCQEATEQESASSRMVLAGGETEDEES